MDWVSHNAAAIQAIASIIGVLITAALAGITYWYVRVTREIAKSSALQVKQMRDEAQAKEKRNARALGALVSSIRNTLGALEPDAPRHDQLTIFNRIGESDIIYFQTLASQVDNAVTLAAASAAVTEMREILGTVQEAKRVARGAGWLLSNEQIQCWRSARQNSDRDLHAIEDECERLAGQ